MPLVLKYKAATTIPVELYGLTPDAAAQRSLAEVERLPIQHGNRQVPLAEFFDVSGSVSDGELRLEGDLRGVHGIGAQMAAGIIRIEGDAGRHLGSQMTGGEIHVSGSAGDWVGAEMRGGLIHVRGDAGNQVGGAYPGSRRGIRGGTILIGGRAGDEVGHTMRRGTVVVGGDAGAGPAARPVRRRQTAIAAASAASSGGTMRRRMPPRLRRRRSVPRPVALDSCPTRT